MTHAEFVAKFRETARAFDDAVAVDVKCASQDAALRQAQDAAFNYALAGLDLLDPNPRRFQGRYISGRLCLTLDEAVRAMVEMSNGRP